VALENDTTEPGASLEEFLRPSATVESDHAQVLAFVDAHASSATNDIDAAVSLYYAVRDRIRYDAYHIETSVAGLSASRTLALGHGWCVSKAILLAACCRASSIPARLGFADVRNHLSTRRLREHMNTDIFYWHGYTAILLEGKWVKATPAFNIELCSKFRLRPLEFDGHEDSIYHPFDQDGRQHMEYINMRGEFADVPIDQMIATFEEHYSGIGVSDEKADFDTDVASETDPSGNAPT